MKLLAFALLCGIAAATPVVRGKRQVLGNCLDAFKNVPNPCTNNPNNQVYFPHPTDNTKFIQCDKYMRMYIIQCPENLEYSAADSKCMSPVTQPPVTQAPAVVNPNPSSGNPCTQAALAAGQLYFAVAGDATKFIECDLLGHPNVMPCASGLVWSESRLSCIYRFEAGAGTGTGTGGTGTGTGGTGTGTGTGVTQGNPCTAATIAANKLFFPHSDKTKFVQCDLWGDYYIVSCPSGLVWNQKVETCASAFVDVSNLVPAGRK